MSRVLSSERVAQNDSVNIYRWSLGFLVCV